MNVVERLKAFGKKSISYEELSSLFEPSCDQELFNVISDPVKNGILVPFKNAKTNGNRLYPICMKYHINFNDDFTEAIQEISLLHPRIQASGVLQHKPEVYIKFRDDIQKLNRFLFTSTSKTKVSRKERSFEIFDEEKRLNDSSVVSLLARLGLSQDVLLYYDTPEYCFNDYIPLRKDIAPRNNKAANRNHISVASVHR